MKVIQIVLAALWIQAAAFQLPTASISGTVVEAGTGKPIAGAEVGLTNATLPFIATTDGDGKFTLATLGEVGEDVRISAKAAGYVRGTYIGPDGKPEIKLPANQKLAGLRIELTPTGNISGRILDRNGNPVPNVAVQALQVFYPNGKKSWKVVESRPTNDLGEFRLFWLKPGSYYIRTVQDESLETAVSSGVRSIGLNEYLDTPPPALIRKISEDGMIEEDAVVPVYFPGTSDPLLATSIEVHAGMLFSGADFNMSPIPVHRVRGRISGASIETGTAGDARLFPLSSPNLPGYFALDGADLKAPIDAGNTFEITGVPSGHYELMIDMHTDSRRWSGRLEVEVLDKDVDNLLVATDPTTKVSARFSVDGGSADETSFQVFAEYLLRSKGTDGTNIEGIIEGSTLTFDNVPSGNYQIEAANLIVRLPGDDQLRPAYIESIRSGNRNVLEDGLLVGSTIHEPIVIVLRTDFGRLSGHLLGDRPLTANGTTVVLVPDSRNQLGRYGTFVADDSGQFRFKDIPPGGYRLFAWKEVEDGAWQNAEFLAAYESRGRAIQIKAGDNDPVDIPLMEAGQ